MFFLKKIIKEGISKLMIIPDMSMASNVFNEIELLLGRTNPIPIPVIQVIIPIA